MASVHVCPLSQIEATVDRTGARSLVTLINQNTLVNRPAAIAPERHLFLGMHDITEPMDGHVLPGSDHLESLISFVNAWDRADPLLIHCYAGVSRSTAAAYIAALVLNPARDPFDLAQTLRRLSPTATPNARLIALADARLQRNGTLVDAIASIGRGVDCFEGVPFALDIQSSGSASTVA